MKPRPRRRSPAFAQSPDLQRADVAQWLRNTLLPGDLVLSGSRDRLSQLIRWGTMSDFSHAALALGEDRLLESYDWAGTPCERDGGVTKLPLDTYAKRGSLMNLGVLRPKVLDLNQFKDATQRASSSSPPFPSTTGAILALAGMGDHPRFQVPGARRFMEKRLHLLGDGAARVTCAELAARLYLASDVPLSFQTIRLLAYAELLPNSGPPDRLSWAKKRTLDVDVESQATPTALWAFIAGAPHSVAAASKERVNPDWADLLVPGDFLRSSSFDVVAMRAVTK